MNAPHFDIANYLNASAIGILGTDLFSGEWGDVDAQILVMNSPGSPSDLKDVLENPGIQILVRGEKNAADYLTYDVAKTVSDFLLSAGENVDIDGTCYTGFEESSNIANLGKDDNNRFNYSMNFMTYRNRF